MSNRLTRKTCDIQMVKDEVNRMIADPTSTPDGRIALGQFLVTVLCTHGQYRGYVYLEWMQTGYQRWQEVCDRLQEKDPALCPDRTPYFGDQTRVKYL